MTYLYFKTDFAKLLHQREVIKIKDMAYQRHPVVVIISIGFDIKSSGLHLCGQNVPYI